MVALEIKIRRNTNVINKEIHPYMSKNFALGILHSIIINN